jgi:P4 family phage/plasmid primase-like protien
LLCFKNGVVDFKTKEFRRGRPEDYLTKCTNIDYFTDANDAPKYAPIIAEIHDFMRKLFPVPELEEYMWQHLASVLMGVHPDQTWNIYIGDGQNGKSVLVKLMEHVLGEYKGIVPLSLLTDSRTKIGGTSPEVVGLVGLRYAVMQEPTKGQRVNEGVMKQLVSGIDPIQARGLYMQHAITFYPQFKLILCTNYLMDVKSNDHGTWRRIRTVPFMSLFTENPVNDDPERPYQFKAELGIEERTAEWKEVFASLLVLKAFQTEGRVKDCDIVLNASNEYRKSQDNVSEFVADCIVADGTATIPKSELTSYFNHWIQENYGNSKAGPSLKDVVAFMDKKYKKDERSKTKGWMGCRLVDNRRLQEEVDDSDIEEIEDM